MNCRFCAIGVSCNDTLKMMREQGDSNWMNFCAS